MFLGGAKETQIPLNIFICVGKNQKKYKLISIEHTALLST